MTGYLEISFLMYHFEVQEDRAPFLKNICGNFYLAVVCVQIVTCISGYKIFYFFSVISKCKGL